MSGWWRLLVRGREWAWRHPLTAPMASAGVLALVGDGVSQLGGGASELGGVRRVGDGSIRGSGVFLGSAVDQSVVSVPGASSGG